MLWQQVQFLQVPVYEWNHTHRSHKQKRCSWSVSLYLFKNLLHINVFKKINLFIYFFSKNLLIINKLKLFNGQILSLLNPAYLIIKPTLFYLIINVIHVSKNLSYPKFIKISEKWHDGRLTVITNNWQWWNNAIC